MKVTLTYYVNHRVYTANGVCLYVYTPGQDGLWLQLCSFQQLNFMCSVMDEYSIQIKLYVLCMLLTIGRMSMLYISRTHILSIDCVDALNVRATNMDGNCSYPSDSQTHMKIFKIGQAAMVTSSLPPSNAKGNLGSKKMEFGKKTLHDPNKVIN